jgi:glycerophosphoryl diester phosphodiesterase
MRFSTRPQGGSTGRAARILLRLWAGSVGIAVVMVAVPAHAAQSGDFSLDAHRGYHVAATEDTIGALDAAEDAGASAMEADLRLTADRYIVVMHDATLDRTTNCSGPVDEWTMQEIRERCRADDGQAIPFAPDLLDAAEDRSMNLLMEIKGDPQRRWDTTQLQTFAKLIDSEEMRERVMVSAMNAARLRRLQSVAPWLPTMWIDGTSPTVDSVNSSGVKNVSASAANLSPQLVADLNEFGHLVYGRVSNSQSDWDAYRADGTAGVITDAVPEYLQWASGGD